MTDEAHDTNTDVTAVTLRDLVTGTVHGPHQPDRRLSIGEEAMLRAMNLRLDVAGTLTLSGTEVDGDVRVHGSQGTLLGHLQWQAARETVYADDVPADPLDRLDTELAAPMQPMQVPASQPAPTLSAFAAAVLADDEHEHGR